MDSGLKPLISISYLKLVLTSAKSRFHKIALVEISKKPNLSNYKPFKILFLI